MCKFDAKIVFEFDWANLKTTAPSFSHIMYPSCKHVFDLTVHYIFGFWAGIANKQLFIDISWYCNIAPEEEVSIYFSINTLIVDTH